MNGFYNANTEEAFNKITVLLQENGYEWVGLNKNPTFAECKERIHGNGKLVICAFYNDITGKKEIQFGTKSIYESYPQLKNKVKPIDAPENGKRYLIMFEQEKGVYLKKFAYWFDKRITERYTFDAGFYQTKDTWYFLYPRKNVVAYIEIPDYLTWKNENPIEGEWYLVYRVGTMPWYSPHYTLRKYHKGSFGSKDVKYWILLSKVGEK